MNKLFRSPDAGPFGRRLRQARGARIPVFVVTGFLGAGKTTLVKKFLDREAGRGTAVLVNEFGAVGIDDLLLRESAEDTVLLGNGCLCCNIRSDLQIALRKLIADRERGRVPQFRRVVIETSGLADPGPILRTFATDRALGGEFHIEAVITVVDAVNGARELDDFSEARRQVIIADRLVLTKSDLTSAKARNELTARLRELNPRAPVAYAHQGEPDVEILDEETGGSVRINAPIAEECHSENIASFTLTWQQPLPWPVVARVMDTLLALRGDDILRAKGLLAIQGCSGPVVVQFVQHLAHPPVELQVWPNADRSSRLVFIVRDIGEGEVRALFDAVDKISARPRESGDPEKSGFSLEPVLGPRDARTRVRE